MTHEEFAKEMNVSFTIEKINKQPETKTNDKFEKGFSSMDTDTGIRNFCFIRWKSNYWIPDKKNIHYKSDRVGLLILSALVALIAEVLVVFTIVIVFDIEYKRESLEYSSLAEPDLYLEHHTAAEPDLLNDDLPDNLDESLIYAILDEDLGDVKRLVNAGADVNYKYNDLVGSTPLIIACNYNLVKIGRYLIDQGADISISIITGTTPLMASAWASEELFYLLVSIGADISVKDEYGHSAFSYSISGFSEKYVEFV